MITNALIVLRCIAEQPYFCFQHNDTPLHVAIRHGHLEIAKLLVQLGADPNSETKDHFTALHLAISEGHTNFVKFLIDSRACDLESEMV